MSFEIGQQVGAYRIERQLGKGGMATVYLARHQSLDRDVAIKMLHVAYKDDDTFIERFRREAQIVGKLDHPNIVPIYDFADAGLHPYLVMKYIEGETLKQYLRRNKDITLTEVMRIMTAVADALDFAHKRGILHRDVKPSNIMISSDGQPYLTDFGLARIASLGESTLSRDMMLGTPQYISPEQAQGNRELDARTDIYSLAIVLYELVVGRVPFTGDTPYAIIHNHIFTPLPPPREMNPTVPPEVETVLLKALAKDPNERFSSAGTMINAFQQAIQRENLTELSASSVRPEAFAEHAAKSMQQPMIQSPMQGGGSMPVTPTPTPTGGMWVSNTKRQTKRQRFFGRNLWALSGCGIFICSCLMILPILGNASSTADTLAVEPIFSSDKSDVIETLTAIPEFEVTVDSGRPTATPTPEQTPTRTPYPTRDEIAADRFDSLSAILDNGLSVTTAQDYIDANPEDPLGYFALGILYLENDQFVDAQRVFAEVMRQREPSPSLILEVYQYLDETGDQDAGIRLMLLAMNLHAEDESFREQGRAHLYEFADSSDSTDDLLLLCQIAEGADNPVYTQSLMGLYFINNNLRLEVLRWPRLCSDDVQAPIEELVHIDSDQELLPELSLIQAKYYYRINEIETATGLSSDLLENEDIPAWLVVKIEEFLAGIAEDTAE